MPRDGSGNYTLPVGNPVVSDTVISSDWANDTCSDIATQLNNVLTRDGILGPTNPFKLIDGAVGTPGLGFNSEPGLGIYRVNTSILGFAAAGKQIEVLDASSAAAYVHNVYPRAAGSSELRLNTDIYGTADTTVLKLAQTATQSIIQSLGVGAGTAKPLELTASAFNFNTGLATFKANAKVATGGTSSFEIDRVTTTTQTAFLNFTTGGSKRFQIILGANDETGNAGNLSFYRFLNDGATSENALNISRADGVVTTQRALWVGTAMAGGSTSLIVTRDAQFGGAVSLTAGNLSVTGAIGATGAFTGSGVAVTGNISTSGGTISASGNISSTGGALQAPGNASAVAIATSFLTSGSTRVSRMLDASSPLAITAKAEYDHNPGVAAHIIHYINTDAFTMTTGGVGSSTGGWVATSDRRVKENIVAISGALDKLLTLGGYTYDKVDMVGMDGVTPRKAGFIAQEIQAVLPEAVIVGHDEMGTLSVDHNGVIGLLIEAVKELHALVTIH